jgi:hypothetical protein
MQLEECVMIRDAAAVIFAYVLGLRESSVMSLPAENKTHTAAKMTVRLVLVKGKELRHAVLATNARTGVAILLSPIDLFQKWTGLRPAHALLFGLPGDVNDWQPGVFLTLLFWRPDHFSLTNSYVDDNSCLIRE